MRGPCVRYGRARRIGPRTRPKGGTMRILTLLAALAAASVCSAATGSTLAGPSPGVMLGSTGVLSPDGKLRYVTVVSAQETVVEKIAVPSGAILRSRWLQGAY